MRLTTAITLKTLEGRRNSSALGIFRTTASFNAPRAYAQKRRGNGSTTILSNIHIHVWLNQQNAPLGMQRIFPSRNLCSFGSRIKSFEVSRPRWQRNIVVVVKKKMITLHVIILQLLQERSVVIINSWWWYHCLTALIIIEMFGVREIPKPADRHTALCQLSYEKYTKFIRV